MSDWRTTREYRIWRATVIMRDKRCVVCGTIHNRHAHHINHATYFPDLRFDPLNGVTLCGDCHMNYHCNFHRSYRTKCDLYNFNNFMYLAAHFHRMYNPPEGDQLNAITIPINPDLENERRIVIQSVEDGLYNN